MGFLDLREDDAAPLPPRQAREAQAAAAAAPPGTPPFVAYHVMLPWGRAVLAAAAVKALPTPQVAAAIAASAQTAIATGGAQSLSSAGKAKTSAASGGSAERSHKKGGGLVKPLKVDPAALKPDAAAASAAIVAAGSDGQLVSAGLQVGAFEDGAREDDVRLPCVSAAPFRSSSKCCSPPSARSPGEAPRLRLLAQRLMALPPRSSCVAARFRRPSPSSSARPSAMRSSACTRCVAGVGTAA